MDIITALSPATPALPQAAADGSAMAGEATPFDAVLQQVQNAEPVADREPAVPRVAAPVTTPEPVASVDPRVPEQLPPAQPALPAVASEPVQPEPEPEALPAPPPSTVASEAEPVEDEVMQPQIVVAQEGFEQDEVTTEDDPEPASDSLDAIRQRLELIDSAGMMASGALAVAPPVTWVQTPAAVPELQADLERGTGDKLAPAVDLGLAVDNPVETAMVTEGAGEEGGSQKTDGAFTLTPDWDLSALPSALALTVGDSGSEAAPALVASAVGSDEWQADLGQQVVAMVRRGDRQVDVQLHPADLGPLSISLNVSESGVQAQFQSIHASVRAAVEQALPQLQSALASQGLSLGQASVNDGASRQAMGEQAPRRDSPGGQEREQRVAQKPAQVQQVVSSGVGVDLYL